MTDIGTKLDALLDVEREALLQGDLERISALMEEKEQLVDCLADNPGDRDSIAPLKEKIQRNVVLFDSVLAGVRAVVARLGALQTVQKSLETYDSTGQRYSIGERVENRLEKRA